ncbi:shikimate dehydrogenase [Herbiconiux daphne]|uniref:Shikimate dehydrogenase n=1 Tax=Herbiconiux daphne TaxID=2970914 RepID=A0ABT2GZ67_9MICO|nr:shikimate dehydrogenase [Herbiconiux daphne]MCS5733249.1 shikimate dehydrogenase [Herbiconiux daphne]
MSSDESFERRALDELALTDETFSADPITGDTDERHAPRRLGVLGSPIAHSKSPALHRVAYAALGLPWRYDPYEVTTDALAGFVDGLTPDWRGLSLTMPLKETVFGHLDAVDAIGRTTRSVNTVLVTHDDGRRRLEGFNTDVYGTRQALERAGIRQVTRALVVGGGATARSAVVAVAQLGAEHVDIVLRSPDKAAQAAETARAAGVSVDVVALHDPSVEWLAPDLTISTLPGGVGAAQNFAGTLASTSSALLDVSYDPWPSEFAALWQESDHPVVSGLAMLVHQAVAQLRVFVHGDPLVKLADEERITAAMLDAVGLPPTA